MPETKNNVLIPCGKSQLETSKIEQMGLGKNFLGYLENLKTKDERGQEVPGENFLENPQMLDTVGKIAQVLSGLWANRDQVVVARSCQFGAELATLVRLAEPRREQDGKSCWYPELDRIVIFASQTFCGIFAAKILQCTLRKVIEDNFPGQDPVDIQESVQLIIVDELCEKPIYPEQVMVGFSEQIISQLRFYQERWNNIFVMSGGFKSTIPMLTLFSLFYGVELIYLFETSSILQELHPVYQLDTIAEQKQWAGIWEKMKAQEWSSEYLNKILEGRLTHPKAVYSNPNLA